jgi:hypothetical protein
MLKFFNIDEGTISEHGEAVGVKYAKLNTLLKIKATDHQEHGTDAIENPLQAFLPLLLFKIESFTRRIRRHCRGVYTDAASKS